MMFRNIQDPDVWHFLGYFGLLWARRAEWCCTPLYLLIEVFRQKLPFCLDTLVPKYGWGGSSHPSFLPNHQKTLEFSLFWSILVYSGVVLQKSAAHQCTCLKGRKNHEHRFYTQKDQKKTFSLIIHPQNRRGGFLLFRLFSKNITNPKISTPHPKLRQRDNLSSIEEWQCFHQKWHYFANVIISFANLKNTCYLTSLAV